MKFKSNKDLLFNSVILGLIAFLIGISINGFIATETKNQELWPLLIIMAVVVLLFWVFLGTHYELRNNALFYNCGPFRGKISVHRITEITKVKTLWVGFRPATSRKGLIIKYDKFNEIYISPKTNTSFIKKILELNSDIKITD